MENLLRPWVIALLLASGSAALAWLRGLSVAIAVLARFRPEARDEAQIALSRRAELGARFIALGGVASGAAVALLVLGADHAAEEIRGAMCAHGVLASTRSGFVAAALGLAVLTLSVAWAALHRLDLELRAPTLTRPKFLAFVLFSPLAIAAAAFDVAFVMELDFDVVATCCSTSTGEGAAGAARSPTLSSTGSVAVHFASLTAALAATAVARRFPSRASSAAAGGLVVAAALASIPALIHHVAPHIYETPAHRCPFCLLHLPELAWGAPLYASMALAVTLGISLLVRCADPRWSGDDAEFPRAAARRGSLRAALALLVLALLFAAPVLRYRLLTGASLFGS